MMRQTLNIPVQLISSCSTLGDFRPLRFRYEDEFHVLHTVQVEEVLSSKVSKVAGVECLIYTCSARVEDCLKIFTLKYYVRSHKWSIDQMLS